MFGTRDIWNIDKISLKNLNKTLNKWKVSDSIDKLKQFLNRTVYDVIKDKQIIGFELVDILNLYYKKLESKVIKKGNNLTAKVINFDDKTTTLYDVFNKILSPKNLRN